VLGLSPASSTLAQMTIRRPVGSALDLGTGCGVQSLHLATHADRVVATDLNPRAVSFARLTGALNELILDVREGSLYEPVSDETFDLIVTNPPYVMSPPTGERLVYREGGFTGDRLVEQVVRGGGAAAQPGRDAAGARQLGDDRRRLLAGPARGLDPSHRGGRPRPAARAAGCVRVHRGVAARRRTGR
jgi:hypothetical protein